MTREEAIKKFELQLLIRSNGYYDHLQAGGKQDIAEEEHLEAMQMAIAALREQPQWISVEDALPDDSFLEKEIIVCILNRFGERNVYTKKFWGVNSALWNNDITHWMPLPEGPKEEV